MVAKGVQRRSRNGPDDLCLSKEIGTSTRIHISPTIQQQLVVSRPEGQIEAFVSIGPVVLSFEDLFLRKPARGQDDILFTDNDLGEMAKTVCGKKKYHEF